MSEDKEGILARMARWGVAAENATLVVLFAGMMLLAVTQIALRIFFSSGFVWTNELIKLIVLWITLVSSIAASRSDRHLRIDIVSQFVPDKYARFPRLVVDAFASIVCATLAWHSYLYIELLSGETILFGIPSWVAYGILPLSLSIMAYRFLVSALALLGKLVRGTRVSV